MYKKTAFKLEAYFVFMSFVTAVMCLMEIKRGCVISL